MCHGEAITSADCHNAARTNSSSARDKNRRAADLTIHRVTLEESVFLRPRLRYGRQQNPRKEIVKNHAGLRSRRPSTFSMDAYNTAEL